MSDRFIPIQTGLKVALESAGAWEHLPSEVCPACFEQLRGNMSQGLQLRVEQATRDKNLMIMWKGRTNLIKQARSLMEQKAYSEAAVHYEKYIRILEVVHDVGQGALTPDVFSHSKRSREMTVIAAVYWDLLRIYDTSPRYGERMLKAAEKLAIFLPYTPMYADVIRRAEAFIPHAKNPGVVRQFLKAVRAGKGPCFIATVAFQETPWAPELWILRRYRDEVLKNSRGGRKLVLLYYRFSPAVAENIRSSQWKTRLTRCLLQKIAARLKKSLNSTP